eukprot:snap_masked-scaffold_6-processed-gene-19.33-mRNA-1 protein AED:1.00 eAED:1.00 QI:0/0/0/0/1/1/3/0/233
MSQAKEMQYYTCKPSRCELFQSVQVGEKTLDAVLRKNIWHESFDEEHLATAENRKKAITEVRKKVEEHFASKNDNKHLRKACIIKDAIAFGKREINFLAILDETQSISVWKEEQETLQFTACCLLHLDSTGFNLGFSNCTSSLMLICRNRLCFFEYQMNIEEKSYKLKNVLYEDMLDVIKNGCLNSKGDKVILALQICCLKIYSFGKYENEFKLRITQTLLLDSAPAQIMFTS